MGLTPEVKEQIFKLGQEGHSTRAISAALNVSRDAVKAYRDKAPVKIQATTVAVAEPELYEAIRKALKKGAASPGTLADALDVSPKRVDAAINDMRVKGAMITWDPLRGLYDLTPSFAAPAGKTEIVSQPQGEWSHVFGAI